MYAIFIKTDPKHIYSKIRLRIIFYFHRRIAKYAKNLFLLLSAERAERNKEFIPTGKLI